MHRTAGPTTRNGLDPNVSSAAAGDPGPEDTLGVGDVPVERHMPGRQSLTVQRGGSVIPGSRI